MIKTEPIEIDITHAKHKEEIKIHRQEVVEKPITTTVEKEVFNKLYLALAVLIGIVIGILLMIIKKFISFEKKKKLNLKDTKMLLVKLMPYKENHDVKVLVDTLENNLYAEEKQEIDKKTLKEIIKKYEIN